MRGIGPGQFAHAGRSSALAVMLGLCVPLGAGGCADQDVPFELVEIDFADDRTLTLTFTKAVASVTEVDPSAFRISLARSHPDLDDVTTQYFEVGEFGLVEDCLEDCFYDDVAQVEICDQTCPAIPAVIEVDALQAGKKANRLDLSLDHPVGRPQCDWIEDSLEDDWDAGFIVHYDGDQDPPVTSKDGEALRSMMAHWVDGSEFVEVDERFPEDPGVAPIPCPR